MKEVTPYTAADHWSFRELDFSEPFFITQCCVLGVCATIAFVLTVQAECLRRRICQKDDDDTQDDDSDATSQETEVTLQKEKLDRLLKLKRLIALINFTFFVVYIFVVMCGRFVVLWKLAKNYYAKINIETGALVYMNNETFYADLPSNEELKDFGCDGMIANNVTSFVDPPEDYFTFLVISLEPNMAFAGFAAFSMICGLIIFLFLQSVVAYLEILADKSHMEQKMNNELPSNCLLRQLKVLGINLLLYIAFELIQSQQSVVLMPLNQVTPTPYCLVVDSPPGLPEEKLVKFFVWSVAGIPIGLPCAFIGYCIVECCGKRQDDDTDNQDDSFRSICVLAGFLIFISGVGLFGCWLCLGVGIGPWVNFSSKYIQATQTTNLLAELSAPFLFLAKDFVEGILEAF